MTPAWAKAVLRRLWSEAWASGAPEAAEMVARAAAAAAAETARLRELRSFEEHTCGGGAWDGFSREKYGEN